MKRTAFVGSLVMVAAVSVFGHEPARIASYTALVDPFIGVDRGETAPGAEVPFGFVNAGPDTVFQLTAGYSSKSRLLGFSQTHVSGTGGAGKYGNFRVTPYVGLDLPDGHGYERTNEIASPGYYAVTLLPADIRCELTATRLAAMHRYTFQSNSVGSLILDVSSIVQPGPNKLRNVNQRTVSCQVCAVPPNRIEGTANYVGGWNPGTYTLHFAAEFDRSFESMAIVRTNSTEASDGTGTCAVVTFKPAKSPVVKMRIAVSFISLKKARKNLDEITGWDFDATKDAAEHLWQQALEKIQVTGGTPAQRKIFYTALYHAHLMPHDLTGENIWWPSREPHYEDYYCVWDTFRTLNPLLTLIEPERQRDIVRSLIDTFEHSGWLPDARIAGHNGLVQGGSNGDVLMADAILKGLKGIDYEKAYAAVIKDAEVESSRPNFEGRILTDYTNIGYVPVEFTLSASRTLEYAYNDFCIANVAQALGKKDDYQRYLKRSRSWENLWDEQTQSIRPRNRAGVWLVPFKRDENFRSYAGAFYEGTPWQYSTFVPHDVQGLINHLGGDVSFAGWLDSFFNGGHYTQGNEPDLLAPYLYIHAGRPDKTAERVRSLLESQYQMSRLGLPGDDDSGTMSAWYVFSSIGLYPNAGQGYYYLTPPIFPRTDMDLGHGKHLMIEAAGASAINRYIVSARLNGKPLTRAWVKHEELIKGGVLQFELGDRPTAWGQDDRPPSLSTRP